MPRALLLPVAALLAFTACSARRPTPSTESLASYIAKLRQISATAAPRTDPQRAAASASAVESSDPALAALLKASLPAGGGERAIGDAYRQRGVLDTAHAYYVRAIQRDQDDAAAYDGLARIWRDWGFPHLALPDAHRAVFHAPASAPAHNTLGTIYQALGRTRQSRAAYERALALDPAAGYAVSNLCGLAVTEGYTPHAIAACRAAVTLAPHLAPARNNLALAYAASGDVDASIQELAALDDVAMREYNRGVVFLIHRRYADAATAFAEASRRRSGWPRAAAHARNAVRILKAEHAAAAAAQPVPR